MANTKFSLKQHWLTRQWRWQVKANNGNIIGASTESYFNKVDCVNNAISLGMALTKEDFNLNTNL